MRFTHDGREWEARTEDGLLYINCVEFSRLRVTYDLNRRQIVERKFGPSMSMDGRVAAAKTAFAEALVAKALAVLPS